jgi:predicted nucleic acid-binding protein
MIVVSNTSPLTNLAAIGQFDLFRLLFHEIILPEAVIGELSAGGVEWPGFGEVKGAAWVVTRAVTDRQLVDALRLDLDRGEAETVALPLELDADLVLLDEKAGRLAAQHFGLEVMGAVGILLRAKQLGYVDEIRPLLDGLRWTAGFFLDDALYQYALKLAFEDRDVS